MALPAKLGRVRLQHRPQSLDPRRQAEALEAVAHIIPRPLIRGVTGSGRAVIAFVMALLSSRELAPRAYGLKAGNAASLHFKLNRVRGIPGATRKQEIVWMGSKTNPDVALPQDRRRPDRGDRDADAGGEAGERDALEHAWNGEGDGHFGFIGAAHLAGVLSAAASHRDGQALDRPAVRREDARYWAPTDRLANSWRRSKPSSMPATPTRKPSAG